jgi:hypothetical protein
MRGPRETLVLTLMVFALFMVLTTSRVLAQETPPSPLRFGEGKSSATVRDNLRVQDGYAEPRSYSVRASAGQVMTVKLTNGAERGASFSVACPGHGGTDAAPPSWTFTLPESGDYVVTVNGELGEGEEGAKAIPYALEVSITGKLGTLPARGGVTGTYVREDDSFLEAVEMPGGKVSFYLQAYWKGANWKEYGPNLGESRGIVSLKGGKAVFKEEGCTLTLTFSAGALQVAQQGDCGYGHNVVAEGTYKKTSVCAAPGRFRE